MGDSLVTANDIGLVNDDTYGILIYDVPSNNQKLYNKLRTRITRRAIRMNQSVYIMKWGMKDAIQDIVDEAFESTGQRATVCMLPFDPSSRTEILQLAKDSLINEVRNVAERLSQRVKDCLAKSEDLPSRYFDRAKERLVEAEGLAIMFCLSQDLDAVMAAARNIFEAELSAYYLRNANVVKKQKKSKDVNPLSTVKVDRVILC